MDTATTTATTTSETPWGTTTTVPATIQYTTTAPYTTTTADTTITAGACYRYPLGRDHFRTRMMEAISTAVDNDKLTLSHNGRDTVGSAMRQNQFTEWLQTVFELFYEDITEESPRKCLAEKFKDVEQGETGASNF